MQEQLKHHRALLSRAAAVATVSLLAWSPTWLVNALGGSGGATAWWRHAAFGATGLRLLALMSACVATFWLVMSCLTTLGRGALRHRSGPLIVRADQQGTAIIEFALLFPVATLLFLVILQTAFLYTANFYVNLAAFRAARTAIVWAGIDPLPPDARHTLVIGPRAEQHIEKAAALTCVGISGQSVSGPAPASAADFDRLWAQFVGQTVGWTGERLQKRYQYAHEHTRVRIGTMPRPDPQASEWNAQNQDFYRRREPITVEVTHEFELMVPYAKFLLGQRGDGGTTSDYRFVELKAGYTLINEGQPELVPGLPWEPSDG